MDRQRLGRIFDVLNHVATHGPCTVTEVSNALGTPLSSTHDLLKALADTKLLYVSDKAYGLGPEAIRTALSITDSFAVRRVSRRHMEALVAAIGYDVYLAVNSGNRVIYVSRHAGRQPVNLDIPLGRSLLLHTTAVGKLFAAFDNGVYQAMLAKPRPQVTPETRTSVPELDRELATIRKQGVSISRGESLRGVVGLATPVFDRDRHISAAVHVSALHTNLQQEQVSAVIEAMRRTAAAIENDLVGPRELVPALND